MTPVTLSFVEVFNGFGLLEKILAQLCFGGFVVLLYVCGRAFLVCSSLSLKVDARVSRHLASWWWSYAMKVSFGDYPYTTASSFAL
ncbi:unnamed protein product [Brassica oleracea var. botrytis]